MRVSSGAKQDNYSLWSFAVLLNEYPLSLTERLCNPSILFGACMKIHSLLTRRLRKQEAIGDRFHSNETSNGVSSKGVVKVSVFKLE